MNRQKYTLLSATACILVVVLTVVPTSAFTHTWYLSYKTAGDDPELFAGHQYNTVILEVTPDGENPGDYLYRITYIELLWTTASWTQGLYALKNCRVAVELTVNGDSDYELITLWSGTDSAPWWYGNPTEELYPSLVVGADSDSYSVHVNIHVYHTYTIWIFFYTNNIYFDLYYNN